MSAFKITDTIFSVGVLNPSLRVFDIVMRTEYGTSYNAYLLRGREKTALVDTSHASFFEEYIETVKEAAQGRKIDYIILNHTEPDHSGALSRLLEIYPDAEVLGSAAAGIYLSEILNKKFSFRSVKDNETLSLGGKTLRFLSAPFLHWPDTIFTYDEEEKALFSCDFLGCHFCEPRMFDKYISHRDQYEEALSYYYAAIFSPFSEYVRAGLSKIKDLPISFIFPSHGPILTKYLMDEVIEKYRVWSSPIMNEKKIISIFYASAYGATRQAAAKIKDGILKAIPDSDVTLYDLVDANKKAMGMRLSISDAFLVGTPTINKDAVFPVWELLSHVDAINAKKKSVAVFGSYGWSGEGVSLVSERMKALKLKVFEECFTFRFLPSEEELKNAEAFGEKFAKTLV